MLSVIVPALNEEARLPVCLGAILAGAPGEVIVVDGGSADRTREVASGYSGVQVVAAERGRAAQMNRGARIARGKLLLFCHADTTLPEGYREAVQTTLADPRVALGAFRFRLPGSERPGRVIEWGVALRCRFLALPYGDQALFCRRADFDAVGGYRAEPIMEDVDFVLDIRRRGAIRVLDLAATTSDRAWREHGALRYTLRNWRLAAAHLAGRGFRHG